METTRQDITGIMMHVTHYESAFFRAHPERQTSHVQPNRRGYWLERTDTPHAGWLHQPDIGNLFGFRRILPEGLEDFADQELLHVAGMALVLTPETRAFIQAGRLWVNTHNQGYPVAFVVLATPHPTRNTEEK